MGILVPRKLFTGFVVFDLETTGIFPAKHDRVIEIGIVRLDEDLDIVEEWETLINPDRDIGAYDIHGITASDLKEAPTFQELLADIWHRFEGAIPVAHNFNFDRRFICSEFARAGIELENFDGLCTMRLADQLGFGGGWRKLVDICKSLSIPTTNAHSAGHDAKMCAEILMRLADVADLPHLAEPVSCPTLWKGKATPLGVTRQKSRETPIESPLQMMASRLNSSNLDGATADSTLNEYLLVLDRVIEDRVITSEEAEDLVSFAHESGLTSEDVAKVHRDYLTKLVALVLSDGIVTEDEQRDLMRVAGLLNIECDTVTQLLQEQPAPFEFAAEDFSGKTVCFTGESKCFIDGDKITKERAEVFAENAGLVPKPRVTKALDILIVGDPDTASGKAKKARQYGTRIIAERAFWQKLGIAID